MGRSWIGAFVGAAVLAAVPVVTLAQSTPSTSRDPNRVAYEFAVRCYTVNTVSAGDRRYNPNGQNDASIRAAARRAFDAAKTMGQRLGDPVTRLEDDITRSGYVDGGHMLRDDAYFQRARANCSRLGML